MSYRWNQVIRRGALCLATVSVLTLATNPAQASLVTFKFSGVIDTLLSAGPLIPLATPITKNTPFTGSYSFDSTAPDLDQNQLFGEYAMGTFSVNLLGQHYTSSGILNKIFIFNDPTSIYNYDTQSTAAPIAGQTGSLFVNFGLHCMIQLDRFQDLVDFQRMGMDFSSTGTPMSSRRLPWVG